MQTGREEPPLQSLSSLFTLASLVSLNCSAFVSLSRWVGPYSRIRDKPVSQEKQNYLEKLSRGGLFALVCLLLICTCTYRSHMRLLLFAQGQTMV
eukprot:12429671-Ditylum_brightwellii.AAC.1